MLNDTVFCGSTFWNSSLTWNTTEKPDLTICFEKTILVLIPMLYLWIFLPLELYWLKKSLNKDVPWNWKNITKFLLITMICILSLCDFFSNITNNIVYVDIYMPIMKLITFITAGILLYYNKKSGIQVSGHQFLFWFLCAFCGTAQFRTEIRNFQNDRIENIFMYWTYLIYYTLVLFMFLMNFIPDDPPRINIYNRLENPTPIPGTIYLGRIFYTYFDSLLFRGFKRPVTFKDMWDLEHESESRNIIPEFEKQFQKSLAANREKFLKMQKKATNNKMKTKPDNVKMIYILFKCLYPRFIFGALCKSSVDFIIYVNPQILDLLIDFVESKIPQPQWKGFVYAGLMFAVGTVQSLLHNIHFLNLGYFGLRARTALICSIYKKALRISNATRKDKTAGEIVNLMAVDGERFAEFSFLLPLLWSTPTQITLGIYFLWQKVGIASLAGVAVLIFLIPINVYIVKKTRTLQYQQMREKDERIKVMNEILNGIKVLKLYAWELSFEKLIQSIRVKEIKTLLKAAYLHTVSQFVWNCAPFFVAFVTFLMYVLIDENNVLDAKKAFVSLALINILRAPMNQIPLVFNSIVQTLVSFKRIDSFMNAEELEPYVEHDDEAEDPLVIRNGTFSWGDDSSPSSSVLKNINLTSSQNSITAIVGPVGSGKSSLMSALLGEMHKKSGKVNVNGTLAYVPQQAWIQNCSVRENILFGKSFDKIKYNKVISACALEPDLKMLADGDSTEIGENGINLSGGQKQRISLARAVYDDADIYLLDDPLSAVDSHVGKHIFTRLIGSNGLLNGKVRILVTHAVTYLPKTDRIFVLKDGEIQESGTYKELLSNRGAFADFLMQHIGEEVSDEEELDEIEKQIAATPLAKELKTKISRQRSQLSESSSCVENINLTKTESLRSLRSVHSYQSAAESWKDISRKKLNENFEGILSLQEEKFKTDTMKEKGKLIDVEKTEKGLVKFAVFKYYFAAVGFLRISGTFLFYIGFQGFMLGSSIWLEHWTEDKNITNKDGKVNTGLRDMYIYVYGALGLAQGICIFSANILFARGATGAATKLHKSLINSVLRLPMAFFDVTPIGRILARFSSDIIGIDMRLPGEVNNILSHSLKILGTFVIICYTTPLFTVILIPILVLYIFIQRYFITTTRQIKRLESVSKSPIYNHFSETISGTVVIRAYKCEQEFIEEFERRIDGNQKSRYAAVFANRWLGVRLETIGNLIVLTSALFAVLNKSVSASMVGLSISYSLQITQTLSMLVRAMSDCEASVVSVERIKEYSEVKQEKPWEIPKKKPQQFWPANGNVKFNDYSVRYRPGLDLVLHGVNFSVNGGEKVGIVGRTGAGKSSLTLSLFRIIEGSAGKIYIDDVDISELGLHDLRSKLTIIPQDAVLFSGTLRLNLDPFESYSDEAVWRSVELAHLKEFISSLPEGLYHRVSEGGVNLSIGQRQLICLARALLRKTKILILDEATAAVDLETDDLIQKTIREEFYDCTIITIAHRLNTIMDSNRVLVLDRGQVAEFDTPKVLLSNERSIFYGMCKDAGLAN